MTTNEDKIRDAVIMALGQVKKTALEYNGLREQITIARVNGEDEFFAYLNGEEFRISIKIEEAVKC
jgi:hypothetical protein